MKTNKIMKLITQVSFFIAFLIVKGALAQANSAGNEFTLQSAIDYALKNSPNLKNAELDIQKANYQRKEIVGLGLPQIEGSIDLKDYLEIPTSLLPGQFFGAPAGTFIPVKFGTQYNATAGISASQLIFSSDYILGLKASKHFIALSEKNVIRTKAEAIQNVTKAYYLVLISKERIKLLDANMERLMKLKTDTKAYFDAGFAEEIDVERLEVAYNNLSAEKEKVTQLIALSEQLLKFQMGYKLTDTIILTDKLEGSTDKLTIADNVSINFSQRAEYSLLESQQELNELNLKKNRLSYLPSLVGYAALNYNAQRTEFNFFDKKESWFPIGLIGFTLNVPLFDGLQKHWRIQQSKVEVLKTKNTMTNLQLAIELEVNSAAIAYKNAQTSMSIQEKNKTLAQHVFDVSEKKFAQGVGSNIEIVNAQATLKEAQANYYNALYDLVIAGVDYLKATGNLVK